MRRLFLEYYSGDHGYGQRLKSTRLELEVGSLIHELLAMMLGLPAVAAANLAPPPHIWTPQMSSELQAVIIPAVERWKANVLAAGMQNRAGSGDLAAAELAYTTEEQAWLAQCLTWAFAHFKLPQLLDHYALVEWETERELALGTYTWPDGNTSRFVLQTRPDLVLRRRIDRALVIGDFKSTAAASKPWREQWENSMQFAYGAEAVQAAFGEPVLWQLVLGLVKGKREGTWDAEQGKSTGPDRQNTPLCYTYYRPANPPFMDADFKPGYYFTDEAGKRRTVKGKGYDKVPVWMLDGLGGAEQWVLKLHAGHTEVLAGLLPEVGPMLVPDVLRESFKVQLVSRQIRVVEGLEALYQVRVAGLPDSDALDRYFPQSWQCFKWGRWCQFFKGCRTPGLTLGSVGNFVQRRPHHALELAQIRARGLEVSPDAQGEVEED